MMNFSETKSPQILVVGTYRRLRSDEVVYIGYGGCLGGLGFDIIVFLRPPKNDMEIEWLKKVCLCRLKVKGHVVGIDLKEYDI